MGTFATKACIDNRKKNLLNSNISCRRSHNMANFGPLTAEIGLPVWGTHKILTGFASCLLYCSDVAHRRPTKLCTIFDRLLGWYTVCTFLGAFAPDGILLRAKFTLRPSPAFSYIGSVTARQWASAKRCGVVQKSNYGTFAKGATYIRLGGHNVGYRPTF